MRLEVVTDVIVHLNSDTTFLDLSIHLVPPAFMSGRHILEGVVVLHETLHEIHSKKLDGVILKVDFEKAYDKVKWPFLQQAMRMKGFSETWRNQVDTQV